RAKRQLKSINSFRNLPRETAAEIHQFIQISRPEQALLDCESWKATKRWQLLPVASQQQVTSGDRDGKV
ncbi:MAG: hypothetical protein ACI93T_002450, partial [Porticoccaceae bacterium]